MIAPKMNNCFQIPLANARSNRNLKGVFLFMCLCCMILRAKVQKILHICKHIDRKKQKSLHMSKKSSNFVAKFVLWDYYCYFYSVRWGSVFCVPC